MQKLVSIKKLIEICEQEKIDLGKGDPYNRLRYYTKMGWLPHTTKKSNEKLEIEGFYPLWVIETLKEIEKLRSQKLSNQEISQKINTLNSIKKSKEVLLSLPKIKDIVFVSAILIILGIILFDNRFFDLNNKPNSYHINPNVSNIPTILDSGVGIVPTNNSSVKIISKYAKIPNKVHITLTQDYYPATRYWAELSSNGEYFELIFNSKISKDTIFNWFITN